MAPWRRLRQVPLVLVGAAAAWRRLGAEGAHTAAVVPQCRGHGAQHGGEVAQVDLEDVGRCCWCVVQVVGLIQENVRLSFLWLDFADCGNCALISDKGRNKDMEK